MLFKNSLFTTGDIMAKRQFIPFTPGGTPCTWLAADTEEQAIKNLLEEAAHMPYQTWKNFQARGYTIEELEL